MKAIINTVNLELSLPEVQMILSELNQVLNKTKDGEPGDPVSLRKFGETLRPVIEKHKIVHVIANHFPKPTG